MDLVFEYLMFVELSDDEDVDPDLAEQHLEEISYLLHKLTLPERQELIRYAEERAAEERSRKTGGQERAEVLSTLEENIFLRGGTGD